MPDWLVIVGNILCVVLMVGYFVMLVVYSRREDREQERLKRLIEQAWNEIKSSDELQQQL